MKKPRALTPYQITKECIRLNRKTSEITSRMYYIKPSERRNRRNQRTKNKLKKKRWADDE